jgi:pantoate--beta-alanine ligase
VVTKLFHVVEPDVAVFGRKDYQQWRLITRMVRDLDMAVEVVGLPICREADGLAMSRWGGCRWEGPGARGLAGGARQPPGAAPGMRAHMRGAPPPRRRRRHLWPCPRSRNARLSEQARRDALCISGALRWAEQAVAQRSVTGALELQQEVSRRIAAAGGRVDYVEVGLDGLAGWLAGWLAGIAAVTGAGARGRCCGCWLRGGPAGSAAAAVGGATQRSRRAQRHGWCGGQS